MNAPDYNAKVQACLTLNLSFNFTTYNEFAATSMRGENLLDKEPFLYILRIYGLVEIYKEENAAPVSLISSPAYLLAKWFKQITIFQPFLSVKNSVELISTLKPVRSFPQRGLSKRV